MGLRVVIELESKRIIGIAISKERNMFVAERLLSKIVVEYGNTRFHQMEELGILKLVDS